MSEHISRLAIQVAARAMLDRDVDPAAPLMETATHDAEAALVAAYPIIAEQILAGFMRHEGRSGGTVTLIGDDLRALPPGRYYKLIGPWTPIADQP